MAKTKPPRPPEKKVMFVVLQLQQQESHSYPSWEVLGGMRSGLMIACLAKLVSAGI
jgi:hypothetical protein